jgi:hypothetical protein
MTSIRLRRSQVVVLAWTGLSFLLSLLPQGVGGAPRVVNAVLFMALGPACALMVLLLDRVAASPGYTGPRGKLPVLSPALAAVVSVGVSLTVLVLSSQALLMTGLWRIWTVVMVVTVVTGALTLARSLVDEG